MLVLVAVLIGAVLVGGSRVGQPIRRRPWLLIALCTIAAASYYSLGTVT